jgi:surface polysaccharide O-acyltransferase-like enzyme
MRRHDIDTIRTAALVLLIIYHAVCSFMPWGISIGFITNKDSNWLIYLKEAVFPVYIFHLPLQQAVAYFLFPLPIDAIYKLLLLIVLVSLVSILLFELLKRVAFVRPLIGLKPM